MRARTDPIPRAGLRSMAAPPQDPLRRSSPRHVALVPRFAAPSPPPHAAQSEGLQAAAPVSAQRFRAHNDRLVRVPGLVAVRLGGGFEVSGGRSADCRMGSHLPSRCAMSRHPAALHACPGSDLACGHADRLARVWAASWSWTGCWSAWDSPPASCNRRPGLEVFVPRGFSETSGTVPVTIELSTTTSWEGPRRPQPARCRDRSVARRVWPGRDASEAGLLMSSAACVTRFASPGNARTWLRMHLSSVPFASHRWRGSVGRRTARIRGPG